MNERKKAVIVDDDLKITMVVEKVLNQLGFRVFSADEGKKALELVKKEKPDLLITDILQPGIDGITLCQKVKNDPDLDDVKVILITGVYKKASFQLEIDCNPDGFIEKPIDITNLEKLVKEKIGELD